MDNIYLPSILETYESHKLSFTSGRCNLGKSKFFPSKAEFQARERQQKDEDGPVWLCYSIQASRSQFKLRADLHSYFRALHEMGFCELSLKQGGESEVVPRVPERFRGVQQSRVLATYERILRDVAELSHADRVSAGTEEDTLYQCYRVLKSSYFKYGNACIKGDSPDGSFKEEFVEFTEINNYRKRLQKLASISLKFTRDPDFKRGYGKLQNFESLA
jgi:hypothetical protein